MQKFENGLVRWTDKQHRLISNSFGVFRRVGILVCDAGICEFEYGDEPEDFSQENTFAYSDSVCHTPQ